MNKGPWTSATIHPKQNSDVYLMMNASWRINQKKRIFTMPAIYKANIQRFCDVDGTPVKNSCILKWALRSDKA